MKNNFVKGIKDFFASSPNVVRQQKTIKKQQIIPRVVNFGPSPAQKQKLSQKDQQKPFQQKLIFQQNKDSRYDGIQNFKDFKELGLNQGDIVFGQRVILYQPKFVGSKMSNGRYDQIKLIATNYKLYILNSKTDLNSFSLSKIQKLHKYMNNQNYMKILIQLKDGRKFKFKVTQELIWKKIYDRIEKFAFVKLKKQFFAFQFYRTNKEALEDKQNGWKLYDPIKQFQRMGLNLSLKFNQNQTKRDFKILDNRNGRICDTYPQILVVPNILPEESLIRCSKFRSRNRMPALTYAYEYRPKCFSSMYRSSQSKTGFKNNRSKDDQMMLSAIGNPKLPIKQLQGSSPVYANPNCIIYDARNYMAALGNKISGKGYQSQQYYTNCQVQFLNIPNIHAVRQSYNKVIKSVYGQDNKFWSTLADSDWYDFVFLILNGSLGIANNLRKGINVLVHCSDGWDRTAQLCALSAIILDPFYRTIKGFQILIQKDWIHFGHQFSTRLGQGINDPTSQQRSQIFIQFLDCVSQMLYQFPSSFEFTYKLLKQVGQQAYSNIFGNFLCNCQLQMKKHQISSSTISLWSFIQQNKQYYINPYYIVSQGSSILQISTSQKNMRFFKELFLSNIQAFKDIYDIYSCKFTQDNLEIMYKQLSKEKDLLEEKYDQNQCILNELNEQIARISSHDLNTHKNAKIHQKNGQLHQKQQNNILQKNRKISQSFQHSSTFQDITINTGVDIQDDSNIMQESKELPQNILMQNEDEQNPNYQINEKDSNSQNENSNKKSQPILEPNQDQMQKDYVN